MKKGAKRILAALLSLSMVVSSWVPAITAEAALIKTETVNVAQNVPVSSEQTAESGHEVKYVNDGNVNTTWQTRGAWPSKATLELGAGKDNISKVVVKLGGDDNSNRSVLVTVQYAINNITSDLVTLKEERVTLSGNKQLECSIANPISATHLYVTLSEPLDGSNVGAFWPSVAEIEVYEEQSVTYSNYNNIANQAVISTTGNEHATDGSKNLVDGKDNTLYKFHKDQMTGEKTVTLRFDQARKMDAFRIAFEYVNPNSYNYQFNYSIHARNGEAAYDVIAENITADRAVNWQQYYKFTEKTYSEVKIIMHSCTTDVTNDTPGGYGWPAIAEFEVYGNELEVEDPGNIALKCDVYSSSGKTLAKNVTDGSKNSTWEGDFYPDYVDINLGKNYDLEAVEVYTPGDGYSQYSIYTSMDGRDFEKLAEKTSHDVVAATAGERYDVVDYDQDGREARIVRVYLEYNSATTKAVINEVRVMGTESNTEIQNRPEINIPTFDQLAAQQAVTLTPDANATYQEVYGIIERRLGASYKNWFTLELAANTTNTGYDYYELFMKDGKVHVKGNDGVSLATGINYYLKYFCNVNISQVGDQVKMPAQMPTITNKIHKETKAEVRYSYNYCTLSYSMAFWGEEEWRNELDWLALNGVNVVLDATAQEEVWRRFLGKIGYEHEAIKDFIAGPAYYAWAYMANLSGFGGPVHDSWFVERTELARKNQQIMRNLGMQPVLQGYSGMVPTDIVSQAKGNYKITQSDVIAQSQWNKFQRPTMLVTTSETFDKYAALFYECQEEVYGATSDYYATDPFHEGGTTGGMQPAAISQHVLESLLAADEDGIWIIQAWEGNPSSELLKGLKNVTDGANHALVLDLYAEKEPRYDDGHASNGSYGYAKEFDSTPWVFCMLNNFGGRLGLHGHLDNLAEDIPKALNTCSYIKGIGITPEASVNNPVLYDFLFETVWQNNVKEQTAVIDLNTWLDDYATRRYGAESESANQAWDILLSTVYNSTQQNSKQGAPESIVNARPALSISAASTWGSSQIVYDKAQLEKAAKLLLKDYDKLKNSEGYLYDVATLLQQVLSNSAQTYHGRLASAFNAKDVTAFTEISKEFMGIIDAMEQVTSTSEYYLLGRWVEQAKGLAEHADDFSRDLYEINAKALITTWGSYKQAEDGRLKDYSNRQWAGLLKDFYKARWERWITARTNELNNTSYESNINWFQWEWEWVRNNAEYETTPTTTDLSVLGAEILEKYSVVDENSDDSTDVDPTKMTVEAGDYNQNHATEGDPAYTLDGNPNTFWHTTFNVNTPVDEQYLIYTFNEATSIDGIRFLQRSTGTNGVVTKFSLYVQETEDGEWKPIVVERVLSELREWQKISFDAVTAKKVKFQVVEAKPSVGTYAAAAEIRFTMPAEVEEPTPDPEPMPRPELDSDFQALANEMLADFQAIEFKDLVELVAPKSTLGYSTEINDKILEIAKRNNTTTAEVTQEEAWEEVKKDVLYDMSYEEAFDKMKAELETTLPYILQNSIDDIFSDKESLLYSIKNTLGNLSAKKQLLMGLTYLYQFYDIKIGAINIKDQMLYDTAYFGIAENDLDLYCKLMKIGASGVTYLKPSNTVGMFDAYFKSELTNSTSLFSFLEGEVSKVDGLTPDVWYKNAGNAIIIESASEEDPNATVGLYSKLKSGYPKYILPLLTVSENSIYAISNPVGITIGLVDAYVNPSLKVSDPATYAVENSAFRAKMESFAASQTDYLELWHRIAKDEDKNDLRANLLIVDTLRVKGLSPNDKAIEEWSPIRGEKASIGVKEFIVPVELYAKYLNASAEANSGGMRFFISTAISNDGLCTYTHELTHLLEESVWLNNNKIRDGLDGEFYARGLYETYWSDDPIMNLNMIMDYSGDSSRVYNATPERFQTVDDLQEYAQGMMDVLYTLDYLEAQSALSTSISSTERKMNWFHQMTQTETTGTRHNPGNGTHTDDTKSTIDETLAASLKNVDDLIDNNIIAQRFTIQNIVRGTSKSNEYHVIPLFTSDYSVSENNNGASGAISSRRQAYELLAEYGYYEGMVPYISNQYKEEAAADEKVLSDTYIFDKIFGDDYADMKAFKKAMFARRAGKLDQLKPITITYTYPGFETVTKTINSVADLQVLMDAAFEWDVEMNREITSGLAVGTNNPSLEAQHVEILKKAVYKAYLQLTDDFTTSIYLNEDEPVEADKTALQTLVDNALANLSEYTEASAKAYQDALAAARTVLEKANATQAEVDQASKTLSDAKDNLEKKPVAPEDIPVQTPTKTEKVEVQVGQTVKITDKSGIFAPKALEAVDTTKATIGVDATAIHEWIAKQFNKDTSDKQDGITRYTGDPLNLSECMYTFEQVEGDTYYITGIAADGKTVYLNPNESSDVGYPNTIAQEKILVTKVTGSDGTVKGFTFKDLDMNKATANNYYLQFVNTWCVFNENPDNNNVSITREFQLYELVKDNEGSHSRVKVEDLQAGNYNYVKATDIQDGGQYVIVAEFDSDNNATNDAQFVLRPSASSGGATGRNDHIVKLTDERTVIADNEITITGVSEGTTSIIVGTTQYDIQVVKAKETEKTITLKVGERMILPGTVESEPADSGIAKTSTEVKKFKELAAGGTYMIVPVQKTNKALANKVVEGQTPENALDLMARDSVADQSIFSWKLTLTDAGTYYVQPATDTAKYMRPGNGSLNFVTDQYAVTIQSGSHNGYDGFYIESQDGYGLNVYGGGDSNVIKGYSGRDANSLWDFYSLDSTCVSGVTPGTTEATIGGVKYTINVIDNKKEITIKVGELVTIDGELEGVAANENIAKASMTIQDLSELKSEDEYMIVPVLRTQKALVNSHPQDVTDYLPLAVAEIVLDQSSLYWKITKNDDGKYSIQPSNDNTKYMQPGDGSLKLVGEAQGITLEKASFGNHEGFLVKMDGFGLNLFGGENSNTVKGWDGANASSLWQFRAKEKTLVRGVTVGTTIANIGGYEYHITVVRENDAPVEKDVTVRAGETVHIFEQSGTFEESGLNTLDTTKATAGVETTTIKDKVATLHSGGANYDGTAIDLNNCLYTFNKNADGTYTIVAVTEDGKTVYLNPYTSPKQDDRGFPSTKTPESITIVKGTNGFSFLDSSKKTTGENYRLTFVDGWKVFNENPSVDPGGAGAATTTEFKVYQLQKSEDKYVYTEVTDLSAIQDGAQYYIAAPVDGVEYVLRPSASTISKGSRNDHIAKVTTEKTVTGNEILINGVSAGDTQMTVGNTVYNIHVIPNEQNIEIKKGQSIVLEGSSLTKDPESEYATVEKIDGDNRYQLTGVLDGETTFVLDGVTYHVTVLKEEIASSVGTSNGMKMNRLTMSANNTFDLCVINSESAIKEWKIIDKETGEVAEWASVDANGTVSAKDKADSVEHNGYIVAELADGTRIQIELKLSPAPTGTDLRLYDVYIDDLHHTDVWYGWLYEYDNPNSEDEENPVLCGYTALTKVVEGEVIYVSMGGNYSNALDFFARPENGYALTQMGATGSHGHYMRLEGATPEDTEFIYTPSVAGNGQYHEISADATRKLVQQAMDIDCHGAQGFTRMNDDGREGVSSILNYRSEKLPTVEKTAIGISGPNGYTDNYREYEEGVKAQIGDYVYFKITVDTYECIDLVTYSKVMLDDQLEGAVFVTKEESGYSDLTDADENTLDITEEIDVDAYEAKSHDYYVKYQIQAKDVASVSHSVVNTVALTYEYGTHYSNGTFESDAQDDAEIMILDIPLSSIVADYGLPVTYEFDSLTKYELVSEETSFGNAKLDVTQGDGKYNYVLAYTAAEMLKGVDTISLKIVETSSENEKVGDVKVVGVYPATTVYYEESFADYTSGSGWTFPTGTTQRGYQTTQYLEETSTGNYGYDEKYAVEAAGPSNASEAVSAAAGDTAEFTFKGEGIDIYANCQSEQVGQPTGTVTVLIKDKNNAIEKLMIVNTKVAGDPEGVTNAQNSIANAYNMPVISVNGLEQGEHSVKIVHTRSKEEVDASTAETTVTYPIRLDGFRVYNTLGKSDQSVYEVHKEANPNFTEMRNVVLNALNISSLYDKTNDETNAESLYAEDIANGLTQVLDKNENGANAIILDNTVSSTDYDADNAQDLLDNGPKNELFLYQNQTLTFKLNAGLKNVQLGLKAANGPVTVTGTIAKNISSSTDMFYVIGDIDADAVITITNTSSNILSVTDLKYFTATPDAQVFCEITEETLTTALSAMGYPRKNETQEPTDAIVRIAGSDRYATAYAVAEELKEVLDVDKFEAVVVATGKGFADALSGSYLASVKNAPILLTNEKRTEELVEYVKANLAEDGIVYILGGTAAVPGTVEAGLEGIDVKRLYGEDRYGTNRAVLKEAGAVGRELLIATGRGYADSLSASATGKPILLVKDEITDAHREILRGFDGGKFYIIGGTGAVSEEIQAAIVGQGRIYRIAGENRYETSAKVAEKFFPEAQTACFAYAKEFADGLSGGPLAAALGAPMILTADGKTDDATAYVQSREIQSGIVFGGTARISDEAVGEIF